LGQSNKCNTLFQKIKQSHRACQGIRAGIRENRRTTASKNSGVRGVLFQITRRQERKFIIQGDGKFIAPARAAWAL
jgi:hypothetical protein